MLFYRNVVFIQPSFARKFTRRTLHGWVWARILLFAALRGMLYLGHVWHTAYEKATRTGGRMVNAASS